LEIDEPRQTETLSGWKEISTYLRMSIRTLQRYEHFGLPVRRPTGRTRSAVIATKGELDSWITARPIRERLRPSSIALQPSPTWTDFRTGIAQMKHLREEMARLREEAVASLETLQGRLRFVQVAREVPPSGQSQT
jgi:hypothetical protein